MVHCQHIVNVAKLIQAVLESIGGSRFGLQPDVGIIGLAGLNPSSRI
jgi:hypothetical protein